jgi:molybdopterin converting factor subunit 1
MQVRVLFFGILRDVAGRSSEELELPTHAAVRDVLMHYEKSLSTLNGKLCSIAVSVNQEYANSDTKLNPGDELALLPPVSGGSQRCKITRETIPTDEILKAIKNPEDGAVVCFEGIVRNHSRGRRTLFLEYEAYEPMALKEMESLAQQALLRFQIRAVSLVHRLGRLEIGETSVLIVVASAHRTAAFEACRWLIDTLKQTVPIWKKEHFEDGAVWADGEPFPQQLSTNSEVPASK